MAKILVAKVSRMCCCPFELALQLWYGLFYEGTLKKIFWCHFVQKLFSFLQKLYKLLLGPSRTVECEADIRQNLTLIHIYEPLKVKRRAFIHKEKYQHWAGYQLWPVPTSQLLNVPAFDDPFFKPLVASNWAWQEYLYLINITHQSPSL